MNSRRTLTAEVEAYLNDRRHLGFSLNRESLQLLAGRVFLASSAAFLAAAAPATERLANSSHRSISF